MAKLRDKLRDRVQPMLEPGEQIQEVLLAQTGPSPWYGLLTYLVFFWVKRRIIAVTDRSVVVLEASAWTGTHPKGVLARLPRTTTIGPLSGLWAKATLGGERMYVHKRFHEDVARADHVAATWRDPAGGAPPAGQPLPPPERPVG